jgi:hypothetical protein
MPSEQSHLPVLVDNARHTGLERWRQNHVGKFCLRMINREKLAQLTPRGGEGNSLAGVLLGHEPILRLFDHAAKFGRKLGVPLAGLTRRHLHGYRHKTPLITFAVTLNERTNLFS